MRLFVAVNLPDEERQAAFAASSPLRSARLPVKWIAPDGLHVTLKFLGEVDGERAERIGPALDSVVRTVRPFALTLGGFGAFPTLARPRVFWLGVERHPALELLANDVERALSPLDFESELRPFAPHLTIGRAKKGARASAFQDLERLAAVVEYQGVTTVASVDLMQSTLSRGGATYTVLHRALLGGGR